LPGCTAATHIAYALSDNAVIYPITPSSVLGELADQVYFVIDVLCYFSGLLKEERIFLTKYYL
jgi:hypothetical protein